jgi:hypothetical protein
MIEAPQAHLSHRSPGLTAIYNEIKGSRVNHVLDLGLSSAKSFNFFAQLSCKIRFESLNDLFPEETGDGEPLTAQLERHLDSVQLKDQYDLVLTWDLFNYLDLRSVEWLMSRIAPLCRPDTLIHSIRYLGATIPRHPQNFQILNQYQLLISSPTELTPRHHNSHDTAQLLRLIPDFYLEHTYLNFDGMIPGLMESVWRFQPDKSLLRRRQSSDELADTETLYMPSSTQPSGETHISPALTQVFSGIAVAAQPAILDLGPKSRQNYDFLHGITQHLYAEDLYQELHIQEKTATGPRFKAHMLNYPEHLRFDVVLLWDILNFLPTDTIEDLFNHLRPRLHAGSMLHAIVYSGREIPSAPQMFRLRTEKELEIVTMEKKPIAEPLTSSRLLKLMKTFHLADTFVFRPGMQRGIYEYLFRLRPEVVNN